MKFVRSHWFIILLTTIIILIFTCELLLNAARKKRLQQSPENKSQSLIPDIHSLSNSEEDRLILYGRDLILNTSKYFGPKGMLAHISNGINCGNCHMEAGTKLYTNNFLSVASSYPKYRDRSGKIESVEWRINECMERSLCGKKIDSLSKEMKAMVVYMNWVGKNVTKNVKAEGVATDEIPFLNRAADVKKGFIIYGARCKSCHGENGEGALNSDSFSFRYPPVWGEKSYAVSAGMYRITKLTTFIKNNMPVGATHQNPQLTDDESWDVAAFINSQPHPKIMFAYDWPALNTKPVDYPFGPYTDGFSETQHKYGPFQPIKDAKGK